MIKPATVSALRRKMPKWQRNPIKFIDDAIDVDLDDWQLDTLQDLADAPRVSVRSGQGVGKTTVEAVAGLWFLSCFPYARVVCTAPTRQQLNDVLWAELSKWQSASPILKSLLQWTKTRVYVKGAEERWFAVARTATKPENMQGFHEENMLFIVDEASGVSEPILEAILGTLSGKNNKLLMCGNPTKTSGTFYDSHMSAAVRPLYKTRRVSSRDVARTNKENIEMLERRYGRDSNVVRVRVDGEFPLQEDDVFIPISLVMQSINTDYEIAAKPDIIQIGCDVARFGDDKTVITSRVDAKVSIEQKTRGQDTMKTADKLVELGEQLVRRYDHKGEISVCIDDTGVGGGVVDRLRQLKTNYPQRFAWMRTVPVKFGQRIKHRYYHDSTTYMMSVLRNLIDVHDEDGKPKPVEIVLPNDDELIGQLSSRKYAMTDAAKQKVESKDEMKKRGMPSPDEADSVLLAILPVRPRKG